MMRESLRLLWVNPCRLQPVFRFRILLGYLPCQASTVPMALCAKNCPGSKIAQGTLLAASTVLILPHAFCEIREMTEGPEKTKVLRRLAAILAADIAGYSALMGADEADTVRSLKEHQAVVLPIIKEHGGRVIDTAGDGILAEFGSVVNAAECAVAIQRSMSERNADIEEARRMRFRIGINQGDVVFDDIRVYGDGVNIAARLENLAEPGGICISR